MKIVLAKAAALAVPLKTPFVTALRRVDASHDVVIALTCADGHTGFGSAPPTLPLTGETTASILLFLREVAFPFLAREQESGAFLWNLSGAKPDAAGLVDRVHRVAQSLERLDRLAAHNAGAKGAIETALVDLVARQAGVPLWRVLCAAGKEPRACDACEAPFETDVTLSIGSPEAMASRLLFHAGEGFRAFKTKLSGDSQADNARITALKEALCALEAQGVSGARLRLDANEAFSEKDALRFFARWEHTLGAALECVEQPVPRGDHRALARVARELRVPVLADEACMSRFDLERLLESDACDGVVVKLAKPGGPLGALAWMRAVLFAQKIVLASCMLECHVSLSAMAHAVRVAAREFPEARGDGRLLFDLDGAYLLASSPVEGGLCYVAGRVGLGANDCDVPGLGITRITEGALAEARLAFPQGASVSHRFA